MPEGPFAGRAVVVTGAGSGIGLASARLIAQRGAGLLVLIDREEPSLKSASEELLHSGATVVTHAVDVTDASAVQVAFADLQRCDVLVNSAGTEGPRGGLEDADLAEVDRLFAVNVRGSLACVQSAAHLMKRVGTGGAIVNIASTAALMGSRRLGVYAMSKAAVVSMTRSLALSLAAARIRVNAVCPGSIDSPMFERTLDPATAEAEREYITGLQPLGRLGRFEEVAEAVAFLASPSAGFITGVALPVDGGRLA